MSIQGKEILVIDDVADVRMRCRKVLESLGVNISEAGSVVEAIAFLEKSLPHLILLDLHLPGKSGFDFLNLRARSKNFKSIPVIILSSSGEVNDVKRAITLGACDYILKPLNAALVSQRVRKHVRGLDFLKYSFEDNTSSRVTLNVGAHIVRFENVSMTLESPIRIARNTRITLNPPVVQAFDTSKYPMISDSDSEIRSITGWYITKVNLVGLKETISKSMHKKENR